MAIRIEYSTPAMDYRTQPRTEAHPEIRLYARSVRKTGLARFLQLWIGELAMLDHHPDQTFLPFDFDDQGSV